MSRPMRPEVTSDRDARTPGLGCRPVSLVGWLTFDVRGGERRQLATWSDIMALLKHHGLVGDDAARDLMLCSAPIDAASAT
eukprot:4749842-Prymnesium_polylepis.1